MGQIPTPPVTKQNIGPTGFALGQSSYRLIQLKPIGQLVDNLSFNQLFSYAQILPQTYRAHRPPGPIMNFKTPLAST